MPQILTLEKRADETTLLSICTFIYVLLQFWPKTYFQAHHKKDRQMIHKQNQKLLHQEKH